MTRSSYHRTTELDDVLQVDIFVVLRKLDHNTTHNSKSACEPGRDVRRPAAGSACGEKNKPTSSDMTLPWGRSKDKGSDRSALWPALSRHMSKRKQTCRQDRPMVGDLFDAWSPLDAVHLVPGAPSAGSTRSDSPPNPSSESFEM
eukprot:679050-Hanusia_phi.AAC.1